MSLDVSIRKRFGSGFALEVDFRVDRAFLGILGPSGCGKSMTLKCIAGIERPDEGRIALNGRTLFDSEKGIDCTPQERRVGYLFQDYALFPTMTIRRNIASGMRKNAAVAAPAVDSLLRDFQLRGLGDRYPDQLSGGQRQRAALARMLAAEPEAILLDEPLSALDAHLRERMQLQLMEIAERIGDAVMVTHDRNEAYMLCPEMLAIDNGKVLAHGSTGELFKNPGSVRVAVLTGCKNISPVVRLGPKRVLAVDWGMELTLEREIDDSVTHVGIRAHDMVPAFDSDAPAENTFPVRMVRQVEDPFEWNIHFVNAAGGNGRLWWKVSKYNFTRVPPRIALPPHAIMPLAGGR